MSSTPARIETDKTAVRWVYIIAMLTEGRTPERRGWEYREKGNIIFCVLETDKQSTVIVSNY